MMDRARYDFLIDQMRDRLIVQVTEIDGAPIDALMLCADLSTSVLKAVYPRPDQYDAAMQLFLTRIERALDRDVH
jgi:hypothetical protein